MGGGGRERERGIYLVERGTLEVYGGNSNSERHTSPFRPDASHTQREKKREREGWPRTTM
eukprot:2279967-Rhodomonas_salina.1